MLQFLVNIAREIREAISRRGIAAVGAGTSLQDTRIVGKSNVSIGSGTAFGGGVYLYAADHITIGDDCLIAYGVTITTATHDYRHEDIRELRKVKTSPVSIGRGVWIGTKAIILPGVSIADGVVVGAGAVVTRSVLEANTIWAGIPAKRLKHRFHN